MNDGLADVDMGVHIGQYSENDPAYNYNDHLSFEVSVSANTRVGIQYDVYYEDYNYQWVDVFEPTGITVDDGGVEIPLGFIFLYYGVEYESIWVCSNGFITLNKTAINPNPQSIPSISEPNPVIAVFWRNLHPELGGSITYGRNVYWRGRYYFVVSWNNVPDDNGDPQTFQLLIQIRQGWGSSDFHNAIVFQYKSITKSYPTVVGVEDQVGRKGTAYDYNNLHNQACLEFTYPTKGYRLERLYIKLTKSDNYAKIDFLRTYIGGYNVILKEYQNPFGDTYEAAISAAASLALLKAGIMWNVLLIGADFAWVLANDLSRPYTDGSWGGVKDAWESDNEAYVWAQCWLENRSIIYCKPFDSTLAATIEWSLIDANNRDHVLTITAEAWYRDLTNDGIYTLSTSATLEMHIGSKLSISSSAGGTTNPAPGTYAYEKGSSVTVTAISYSGWHFDFWILDGTVYYQNPITIKMDSDHTLTAYFGINGGGGGGGDLPCPTLFVWNGSLWVDYGVIDIHNSTGEDITREVPIAKQDLAVKDFKAKIRLQEGWLGLNFSESVIDQAKLYAVDSNGNRYLCPLVKAEHSRLGNVLPQLLLSDDVKAQILLLETIDLTFIMPYPTSQINGYIFTIEGCNMYKM
ncbi:MAG: hypothetical protein QXX59_00340 [Candidatus Bathyarchaeia archaeon]